MNIRRIEIGKLINNSQKPDYVFLNKTFQPEQRKALMAYESDWLQVDKDDLSPFHSGEGENYRGLGNVAIGVTINKDGYIYFQAQRRREHEMLGISFQKSLAERRGSRMVNQCAYTQLSSDEISCFLHEKYSLSYALAYYDELRGFRLRDYYEEKQEFDYFPEKRELDISHGSSLLQALVNWFLSAKLRSQEKLFLLTRSLDLKQKVILIDQLQYLLFPFIGMLTYQTEYISKSDSIRMYLFDEDRYRAFSKEDRFSSYKIITEDQFIFSYSHNNDDVYSILRDIPHSVLYSEKFKFLIDKHVPIRAAATLSLFLLNQDDDNFDVITYLSQNANEISDEVFIFLVNGIEDLIGMHFLDTEELGLRVLKLLVFNADNRFFDCAQRFHQKFGFTKDIVLLLLLWMKKVDPKLPEILSHQIGHEFFFAFYQHLMQIEDENNSNIRLQLIHNICSNEFKEFKLYLFQKRIAIDALPKKDRVIFLEYLVQSLDYFNVISVLSVLKEFEIIDCSLLLNIVNNLAKNPVDDYAGQETDLLELVNYCDLHCIKEDKHQFMSLLTSSQHTNDPLKFFTNVFCKSPELLDKWHFLYLIQLPGKQYERVYNRLLELCFENIKENSEISQTLLPLVNNGQLGNEEGVLSYYTLAKNPENLTKVFAIFHAWLADDIFSTDLFQLFLQYSEVENSEQMANLCNKVFKCWKFINHRFFAVPEKGFPYYFVNNAQFVLSEENTRYLLTDESWISQFHNYGEYIEFVEVLLQDPSSRVESFDNDEFLTLLAQLPYRRTIEFHQFSEKELIRFTDFNMKEKSISLPMVISLLSQPELSEVLLKFCVMMLWEPQYFGTQGGRLIIKKSKKLRDLG